ncbi:GNAT family N-acetyltransferase [Echinicola strongylocentroti]|uniref:GNAT family N-acetyltransferase n=1 Tax=Echinicola strongylocentroti TaxID=1795355 RepID=UPI0013A6EFD7|nr:GNAT family N-acetyltransferase [Echinicola strongylocentroti]
MREAKPTDQEAIVDLLKRSLGESLLPKSVALWRWKHVDNPFGESPVLVAEEQGDIVGVRAFMQWEFSQRGQNIKALRAVDTAVHPDYQGRGIFKQLTDKLVQECSEEEFQFIFNTPNAKSMPGYIKMGWQKRGNLPLKMALVRPFGVFSGRSARESTEVMQQEWPERLLAKVPYSADSVGLQTPISPEYMHWRYVKNPLFRYGWFSDGERYLCIFRIKAHRRFQEFRICELLPLDADRQFADKDFNKQLKEQVRNYHTAVITFSGESSVQFRSFGRYRFFRLSKGPLVTLRNLGLEKEQFEGLLMPNGIAFSLGDLELF